MKMMIQGENAGTDDLAQYDEDFNYGLNEVSPEDNFNIRSAEQLIEFMKLQQKKISAQQFLNIQNILCLLKKQRNSIYHI